MFWEGFIGVGCLDARTTVRKIIKLRIIFSFILNNNIDKENWRCFFASFPCNIVDLAAHHLIAHFFFKIIGKAKLLAEIGRV